MRTRPQQRMADETGLTLIEIIIAVSVLGIILPAIMSSFLLGFLESDATRDRIADSNAAQLTSAFLIADIQSSQDLWTTKTDCRPAPFGSDPVRLQLNVIDPKTATATIVSYIDHLSDDGRHRELHRVECGPSGSDATPLVHNLAATNAFTVVCDGDPWCLSSKPKTVNVSIRADSESKQSGSSYSAYEIEFDVNRRATS